jgi:hypothetical protein
VLKKDVNLLNEWHKRQNKGTEVGNLIEWETAEGALDFHAAPHHLHHHVEPGGSSFGHREKINATQESNIY